MLDIPFEARAGADVTGFDRKAERVEADDPCHIALSEIKRLRRVIAWTLDDWMPTLLPIELQAWESLTKQRSA